MTDENMPSPFAFFDEALALSKPVLVKLRSGRVLVGVLKAYDRHLNLVFSEVTETWTENGIEYQEKKQSIMLRGDNVVIVTATY